MSSLCPFNFYLKGIQGKGKLKMSFLAFLMQMFAVAGSRFF
jgi:hypothetical protein